MTYIDPPFAFERDAEAIGVGLVLSGRAFAPYLHRGTGAAA
jgi:hypothetical protein